MIRPAKSLPGPAIFRKVVLAGALLMAGCGGIQSSLTPAGREAERIAELFWWMVAGAFIVWLAVIGLTVYSIRVRPERFGRIGSNLMIVGGGAIVPTVVLAALLVYGLSMLPGLVAPAPEGSLRIAVTGEQWWWRVRYHLPGGGTVDLANEIRLPAGEPVEFILDSSDVIHSFWIPSLGGKLDMFPGRLTRLTLRPAKTGVFRGACAEYCGGSHALMALYVEVMERERFDLWLEQQAAEAASPAEPLAARGRELFLANGCAACHTVRGLPADGLVGPDLTHVGGRLSLGAGILLNEPQSFARWITHTEQVKPGVLMPPFAMLAEEDVRALAAYLDSLN